MHLSLSALVAGLALLTLPPPAGGAATNASRAFVKSHSLGDSYQFDPRDGWEPVMVTNLRYKYRRSFTPSPGMPLATTPGKNSSTTLKRLSGIDAKDPLHKSALRSFGKTVAKITNGIFAFGEAEPVTITWYSGHDLLNPSCWSESEWTPTDKSFVAAVTLVGWLGKPQCFDFLELCSSSVQCTFARVVDSCAGCTEGSRHVDLTQAPFEELASLEQGVLTVQMRRASEPKEWNVDLWGPRNN